MSVVYPEISVSYWQWIRLVTESIQQQAETPPESWYPDVIQIKKKCIKMRNCIKNIYGATCQSCGAPASAELAESGEERTCDSRVCPRCARRKSIKKYAHFVKIYREHPECPEDGRYYRAITITERYDPDNWRQLTPGAIRRKIRRLKKMWANVWIKRKKKHVGEGAHISFEIAGTGNVHAHVLHYGYYWDYHVLLKEIQNNGIDIEPEGFRVNRIEENQNKKVEEQVYEFAKYSIKTPGLTDEKWYVGDDATVIHPVLAASWELATRNLRLNQSYGVFAKVKVPDSVEIKDLLESVSGEAENNDPMICPRCGGAIKEDVYKLNDWVILCRQYNVGAFSLRGPPRLSDESSILFVKKYKGE